MGGGTVLIPMLCIFFGMEQHLAQAVNLIAFVPMAIVALIIHFKNGLVKTEGLFLIILSGMFSCVSGCFLARVTDGETLRRIFGGFLTLLAIVQTLFALGKNKEKGR